MIELAPFISYVFVVTFTPGPNNIMSMTNANKYGFRKTIKFMLGVFTGFFIIMLASSYFNLLLFDLIPRIKTFMGGLGSIYMIYLAIKIIRDSNTTDGKEKTHLNSYFTGIMLQLVNVKVIIYGITVMSSFIIPYYRDTITLALFSLILASVSLLSIISWAFFGSLFQKLLSRYMRSFNIVMGLLLIYSAVSIVIPM